MPIYEYRCRKCEREFEALVSESRRPECPACKGHDLEKRFSSFGVGGEAAGDFDFAPPGGECGTCGDPRGPGSCRFN